MDRYFDQLDDRWRELPLRKQHKIPFTFFLGICCLPQGSLPKYGTMQEISKMTSTSNISKTLSSKRKNILHPCRIH